jgi:inositol transport system permease protein
MIALLAIGAVLSVRNPQFASEANLINIAKQISINGILAVGVTYVLLTGGVDLSLGSVLAFAGVMAAKFAGPNAVTVFVPVMMGIFAGFLCGILNGVIVTRGRIAPFIATLGMMTAARGLALVVSDGKPVSDLSIAFMRIASGDVARVPYIVLILIVVALFSHIVLRHMVLGRYMYAVGGNERASNASGVNVNAVKLAAYSICGACAGLAGVVLASRTTTGQPNAGVGYELDAIAAAVIGGTSLSGGAGGIGGTILGALLIGIINNGLDHENVSSYYQLIIKGAIIIGAAMMDRRTRI